MNAEVILRSSDSQNLISMILWKKNTWISFDGRQCMDGRRTISSSLALWIAYDYDLIERRDWRETCYGKGQVTAVMDLKGYCNHDGFTQLVGFIFGLFDPLSLQLFWLMKINDSLLYFTPTIPFPSQVLMLFFILNHHSKLFRVSHSLIPRRHSHYFEVLNTWSCPWLSFGSHFLRHSCYNLLQIRFVILNV